MRRAGYLAAAAVSILLPSRALQGQDAYSITEMATSVRVGGEVRLEGADLDQAQDRPLVRLTSMDAGHLMIEENVRVDRAGRWIANGRLIGRDSVAIRISADGEGFVYAKEPLEVYLSQDNPREMGILLVLTSRELERDRARANGNAGARRVLNASRMPDSSAVRQVLAHFDNALRFREDEDVHFLKSDFLARIGWLSECIEAHEQWIAHRHEESITEGATGPWLGKLMCARRLADARQDQEDWWQVAETAREALAEEVSRKARFWSNWLDALLKLTRSGGDYWKFGREVVDQPEISLDWADLHYRHYREIDPPPTLTAREITCGAIDLAWATGRHPRRAGCPTGH